VHDLHERAHDPVPEHEKYANGSGNPGCHAHNLVWAGVKGEYGELHGTILREQPFQRLQKSTHSALSIQSLNRGIPARLTTGVLTA
jgi:hypothetical protein